MLFDPWVINTIAYHIRQEGPDEKHIFSFHLAKKYQKGKFNFLFTSSAQ
jgi:hypothetical protein